MNIQDRVASRFLFVRIAMSLEEAKETLGFPPNANPSSTEIAKAYKQKALENHPDRGGDLKKMVEVNKAKEILDGKSSPSYDHNNYEPYTQPSGPSRPKPEPVIVTFDEAKAAASVPSAEWKFKTTTAFSGYGGKDSSGYVLCGKLGESWVFVAVERYQSQNAFTGEKVDEWWMEARPYSGDLRDVAPRAIRELWGKFPTLTKGYNAKVEILPEGQVFSSKMMLQQGRSMAFKDAMDLLGELKEDDPWKGRKLAVTMVLNSKGFGDDQKKSIQMVVNGREFELRPESVEFIEKKTRVLPSVFGTYFYWSGDKKVLTKAKAGKKVLEYLAEKLTHEPQQLRDALSAAAAQMT